MSLAYRLNKKELIFLLDYSGDINSLKQGFGNVFVDKEEYLKIAEELDKKGFVTVNKGQIIVERTISYIFKNIFESKYTFSDLNHLVWIYLCKNIIIVITESRVFCREYIMTPFRNFEDLKEELNESDYSLETFINYNDEEKTISREKMFEIIEENLNV